VIAVDTNILVRLLVKDDERQTRKVTRFFQRLDADGERAHVSDVVVCELMWVLRSAYDFDRADIARTLRSMIAARQLMFDSADRLLRALSAFQAGRGDLADYVIREHARAAGADAVLTFDKALLKDTMFVAP